jgi:hypothetical protein
MMDSLFSILPKGLCGRHPHIQMEPDDSSMVSAMMVLEESERKRPRDVGGSRTPTLISTPQASDVSEPEDRDEDEVRPVKRFRGERRVLLVAPSPQKKEREPPKSPLSLQSLPEDVLAHCLSFLGSVEDRFSLQCTSKQFNKISSTDAMMANIQVGGDRNTGLHGIIQEHDTPETASESLTPYARAGNLEAMYM